MKTILQNDLQLNFRDIEIDVFVGGKCTMITEIDTEEHYVRIHKSHLDEFTIKVNPELNKEIIDTLVEARNEIPKTIGMGGHTNPTWHKINSLITKLTLALLIFFSLGLNAQQDTTKTDSVKCLPHNHVLHGTALIFAIFYCESAHLFGASLHDFVKQFKPQTNDKN